MSNKKPLCPIEISNVILLSRPHRRTCISRADHRTLSFSPCFASPAPQRSINPRLNSISVRLGELLTFTPPLFNILFSFLLYFSPFCTALISLFSLQPSSSLSRRGCFYGDWSFSWVLGHTARWQCRVLLGVVPDILFLRDFSLILLYT